MLRENRLSVGHRKSLMWKHLAVAVSFLTIFRLPWTSSEIASPADLARSFSWFPLVGLMLGLCVVAPVYILQSGPPFVLAVLVAALLAVLTRGLHLDGLADVADGIGGGYTPERRLEIMKDSRTGPFGALALIFAVLLKVAALYTLILSHCWFAILLAPVLSRLAMVLGAYKMPYARRVEGLAKPFLEHMELQQLLAASLLSVLFLVFLSMRFAPFFLGIVVVCAGLSRFFARRWLGGTTGDMLGALNEITEVAVLTVSAFCFCG
jgi:adenosylcobinamide-GDP ribazoletransferase